MNLRGTCLLASVVAFAACQRSSATVSTPRAAPPIDAAAMHVTHDAAAVDAIVALLETTDASLSTIGPGMSENFELTVGRRTFMVVADAPSHLVVQWPIGLTEVTSAVRAARALDVWSEHGYAARLDIARVTCGTIGCHADLVVRGALPQPLIATLPCHEPADCPAHRACRAGNCAPAPPHTVAPLPSDAQLRAWGFAVTPASRRTSFDTDRDGAIDAVVIEEIPGEAASRVLMLYDPATATWSASGMADIS